jgi:hypothetical protein
MPEIFISYSHADREHIVRLSSFLESKGWTVWWDKSLLSGAPYRDEIVNQLATSRAVIVLWTSNSIKSDFVRSEASRAYADQKLIPIKDASLEYAQIPLPFGELHTENLSELAWISTERN